MPTAPQPEKNEEEKADILSVVEVIPIVRGLPQHTLTYFTRENLAVGSFVNISIRNTEALGIVSQVKSAREAKTDLRRSAFMLKKLERTAKTHGLPEPFIKAAEKTATFYATSVGRVLCALMPKLILESPELFGEHFVSPLEKEKRGKLEPLLIQLTDEERFREYKTIIRGAFARSESVLLITPTHEDALRIVDVLSQGISEYVYTTVGKSPKATKALIKKIQAESHPILLVTTPVFTSFERKDLSTIILERENARTYHTQLRPQIDLKVFLEFYTSLAGKTLIYGDSVLSIRALWLENQGRYAEFSPLKWRLHKEPSIELVDMKKERTGDPREFQIFSEEMIALIDKAIKEKRKLFLFGVRKGLAPSTVCRDCGTLLPCTNCGAPVVLHKKNEHERIFLCHACGEQRPSETRCDNCGSWNLVPLGIGVDRIYDEVLKLFPDASVTILDKDHAPTRSKARAIAKKYGSEKGGILVGTELALLYLEKVPYLGVVSMDSLFSIPDFSINERIFYLLTRTLETATHIAVIQTRNIRKEIITQGVKGDSLGFFRTEIAERQELFYPPFSLFIKVTIKGETQEEMQKKLHYLQHLFEPEEPDFLREKGLHKGEVRISMILRVARDSWPDRKLLEKLALLREGFLIKVDPISIL